MSLLRAVRLDLLVELLKPYAVELATFGVDLSEAETSTGWLHLVHRVLNREDAKLPESIHSALIEIADLATDRGAQLLTSEACRRRVGFSGEGEIVSNEDLAFTAYLRFHEVFQAAHSRLQSFQSTTFEEFYGGRGTGTWKGYRGTFAELRQSLRWAFVSTQPGFCRVLVDDGEPELVVAVVHGRYSRRGVIAERQRRRRLGIYAVESHDVIVYDKNADRLCIHAQTFSDTEIHRAAMGALIALDEIYFRRRPVFRPDPLLELGSAALRTTGIDGLERVLLRRVTLVGDGRQEVFQVGGREDLGPWLDEARDGGFFSDRTIGQWTFGVLMPGLATPLEVEIGSPNRIRFDRRVPMHRFRRFLELRGFFVSPFKRS